MVFAARHLYFPLSAIVAFSIVKYFDFEITKSFRTHKIELSGIESLKTFQPYVDRHVTLSCRNFTMGSQNVDVRNVS